MSLFRKPIKRIQRRVFTAADDDNEEEGDPEPPPPPVISRPKKENKPAKATALLSFADEEDEGEVFKVKKSSQSKRLLKKREKEKKNTGDNNCEISNNIPEEKPVSNLSNNKKTKKKTLEGLILSGREALAADGKGDISDDEQHQSEEEEEGGFHRYRAESVRAALAKGDAIPDAAIIHAARKTRQQARELGGDYIPVRTYNEPKGPGSRLVRDDGSGDDDDEDGRIIVRGLELPSDKPKRGTAATSDTEMHSGDEAWEEQQMQKAVLGSAEQPITVCELFAPPPPVFGPGDVRPLAGHVTTPADLVNGLRNRLSELQLSRSTILSESEKLSSRLQSVRDRLQQNISNQTNLAKVYRRAQRMRAYFTDLCECLDEKMPQLIALEERALALHKKRRDFIVERRRLDQLDQMQDILALAARAGATRAPEPEEKTRRAAEREGRRRARRRRREQLGLPHNEGDSSDDELPPDMAAQQTRERESIRLAASNLFSDAVSAFRSARGVCRVAARWRRRLPALYRDAQLPYCLPALLSVYVRTELILWNPFGDEDNENYEKMDWYNCLMMYGVGKPAPAEESDSEDSSDSESDSDKVTLTNGLSEDDVRNDPDLMLVPTILAKVILPKVVELVESAWDPLSLRATMSCRALLSSLLHVPSAPLGRLGAALHHAFVGAVRDDVMLPALPDSLADGPGGAFWRRSMTSATRLVRGACSLWAGDGILCGVAATSSLITQLCTAAAAAAPAAAATALPPLCQALPAQHPQKPRWMAQIAAAAKLALKKLDGDNPVHMKAIEQLKAVIMDAKACEE